MIRTLYARLAITLALSLGLVGLVYAIFMVTTVEQNSLYTEQTLNRDLAKTLVAERNLVQENALNKKALQDMFMAYMSVNPSIEIYLVDLKGKILSYSADPGQVKRTYISMKPVQNFLRENAMFPLLGDDPRDEQRQKVFSVMAIPSLEHPSGYLYVILRGEQYDEVEQLARDKALLRVSAWVVGTALFVSFFVGLLVFYPITRRLRVLSKEVDAFRNNGFHTSTISKKSHGDDELSQLEQNITLMSEQILEQLEELSAQSVQRRDLFANLSHDLRTPLATLHSYLETLDMKANTLDSEKRTEYTRRAIEFSNRLKLRIDELFEIAKLDTISVAPNIEPFSLSELAQDILKQFEAPAQQLGVQLELEAEDGLSFIEGDIALMQRVFENLIGNALHHVKSGDKVSVSLHQSGKAIVVNVSDTGCGIPAEELEKIFNPLYQVDNHHRGGEHSGLGLAIVRRILELHHSKVSVQSVLNEGTIFTFEMAMYKA